MKIADFFIQITAKGDLKELKMIADAQKAIKEQSKMAVAAAKVKVEQLKKETVEIQKQAKQKKEEPKTLKDILIARGKMFDQQAKMNLLMGKGILQTAMMKSGISALAAGFVIATLAVDKMVMKLAQANQAYINFQRQTGMSMQGAMGMSAAMANLDVTMTPQEIMQNMQNLQSNLIGVQFGMGNIAPYQMAGINPWGANFDTIRKQLKGFAPAYRTFLLQQMGLDPRLGALIDLSDKEYANMKAEQSLLYLDPQVRKDIQVISAEVNKMFLVMKKMKDLIVVILGHAAKPLTSFLKMALNTVNIVLEGIAKMPALLKTIEVIVMGIMTWITRGLIWLIPILEDLAVWAAGGNSFFKELFTNPKDVFEALGEHFFNGDFWSNLKDVITAGVKNAFNIKENVKKQAENHPDSNFLKALQGENINLFGKEIPSIITMKSLKDLLRPQGITQNTDRSIIMDNDIVVNASNPYDGAAIGQAVANIYNSIVLQLQRGEY